MNKINRKNSFDKQRQNDGPNLSKEDGDSDLKKPIPEIYVNACFQISGDDLELNSTQKNGSVAININEKHRKEDESDFLQKIVNSISKFISKHKIWFLALLFLLYNIYLGFAIYLTWDQSETYCKGVKLLVVLTSISYFCGIYSTILKPFAIKPFNRRIIRPIVISNEKSFWAQHISKILWFIAISIAVAFIIWDARDEPMRIASGGGLFGFIFLGYIFSKHRSHIVWTQVIWGVYLQFLFGLFILRWSFGKQLFECMGEKISTFLEFTDSGSQFVFGYLVDGRLSGSLNNVTVNGETTSISLPTQVSIFAFKVAPVIIFFSFFISILYFYGVMQILVVKVGWFLQKTVGSTACESLNASGNVFLGMTEAPLMIKPFLSVMTKSELHAVMTGGFATIAGAVMAAYINFGISPSHLISASVMSAPAALGFSKLFYPETEVSKTTNKNINVGKSTERNALEAGSNGACMAVKLVGNIIANLIAFLAFIAFLNALLSWFGSLVNYPELNFKITFIHSIRVLPVLSLGPIIYILMLLSTDAFLGRQYKSTEKWILSKVFIPFSLMMGIGLDECDRVATLIGLKTVINEFVAYQELGEMIRNNEISTRAQTVATFALCGFSNFGSIGIQLGALGSMAPDRKADLASMALRAMIAGSVSCFMTACIAGMLISESNLTMGEHLHYGLNSTIP